MAEETTTTATETTETAPAAQNQATEAEPVKFTQSQLNGFLAKETSKEAAREVKKMLGEYGFDTSGDIKADLAKLKTLKDSQMTEADRVKAQLTEKDTALTTAKEEAETARYESAAARLGVPDDKIDAFVKHARVSDGDTPLERMKNYIAEIGYKAGAGTPAAQNIGVQTGQQGVSDEERLLAAARKQAGLTK